MFRAIVVISILVMTFFVSGCSSRGMMTARHNGKMYYNPGDCAEFNYSYDNPDVLNCLYNGNETGQRLYPASQQQIDNYRYEQESLSKSLKNLSNSLEEFNNSQKERTKMYQSLPMYQPSYNWGPR